MPCIRLEVWDFLSHFCMTDLFIFVFPLVKSSEMYSETRHNEFPLSAIIITRNPQQQKYHHLVFRLDHVTSRDAE